MTNGFRLRRCLRAIYFLVALVSVGVPARADLVLDGGFETPATTPGNFTPFLAGSSLGNWTVGTGSPNDVLLINTTYAEPGITFNAHSGQNAVDLTGSGNTGPGNFVSQNLTTIAGGTYLLSFYLGRGDNGGASGNYATDSSLTLKIGAGPATAYTNSNVTANSINWKLFSVAFTATGTSTAIVFTSNTSNNNYVGLDDVSVNPVPEPSTLVSAAIGVATVLGYGWRRRRSIAA